MTHLPTLGVCSPLQPFPASVHAHLDLQTTPLGSRTTPVLKGFVSRDAQLAFLYQGCSLEVIRCKTNERLAAWTFGDGGGGGGDDRGSKNSQGSSSRAEAAMLPGKTVILASEITCATEMVSSGLFSTVTPSQSVTAEDTFEASGGGGVGRLGASGSSATLGCRAVLVGLANGLVCLFDLRSSKVVRAIQVGHRVTSVEVISSYGGPMTSHRALAEELMFFHGIVAIGTQEGYLFLIDICLDGSDDLEDSIHCNSKDYRLSTEAEPASPYFIQQAQSSHGSYNIANIRQSIAKKGQHLCLSLNDSAHLNKAFQHRSSSTGDSTYFPEEGVAICSLRFIPHLAVLAVGFNYGGWQLWNVSRLCLDFSSVYMGSESLPVVNFTFQEPENDPRNFCYIWTVQSENYFDFLSEKLSVNSFASISLYALSYENRDDGDPCGVLYSGLTSCSLRFEHKLRGNPAFDLEANGSLALSCATLGFYPSLLPSSASALDPGFVDAGLRALARLNEVSDPDNFMSNLGLAVFLWEVHLPSDGEMGTVQQPQYYFGLFDLNAWYQSQMPSSVDPSEIQTTPTGSYVQCPYFSLCSLQDILLSRPNSVLQSQRKQQQLNQLVNIGIDLSSISRYQSLSNTEQHFYPSSLGFDIIAIVNDGFVHATNLGLQRKVLLELQSRGRLGLVEPQSLYQLCLLAGLVEAPGVGLHPRTLSTAEPSLNEQRAQLLTVALENHLVSLLTGCISHWKDGKYSNAGCTLKFLLDWAWTKVMQTKEAIDRVTTPLFDLSCVELNEATRKSLLQKSQQLRHLCQVIEGLIRNAGFASDQGMDELETKYAVCLLINQYLEVVLWFFNAGLLPEIFESANNEDSQLSNNPYPYNLLRSMYQTKRKKMKKKLAKFSSQMDTPGLIIDGLCNELGEVLHANFERDGGDGHYPPPSLYSLLSIFLIHPSSCSSSLHGNSFEHLKHRIIQYIFLDIASYLNGEKWAGLVENLIKFPSAFSLPPSLIKLTQAFWLLDHEDFEEAMTMLLDPLISSGDISHWQHRAILMSFLVQEQPKLALKYSRIRQPSHKELVDVQLHVAILLSNGMVHEAFQFQRQRRNMANASSMLQYFFERAEELGKLDSVLQLSLLPGEEKELINFLLKSSKAGSQEILLMYYLQRSRYGEAMAHNEQMDTRPGNKDMSLTRKAIMDRYSRANLIPNSLMNRYSNQSSLAERIKLRQGGLSQPVPMSVEIKSQGFNPIFHSSTIHEEMERRRQEFLEPMGGTNPYTPFRPHGQRGPIGRSGEESAQQQQQRIGDAYRSGTSPRFAPKERHSVVFPRDVSFSDTSLLSQNGEGNSSFLFATTPTNRSQIDGGNYFPSVSASGIKQLDNTKRMILSFLETPRIKKRARATPGSLSSSVAAIVPSTIATPQSILKIKRLLSTIVQKSTLSSASTLAAVESAAKVLNMSSDEENWLVPSTSSNKPLDALSNEENRSRESTPGKSIRFNVPKVYPEYDISFEDNYDNSSPKKSDEVDATEPQDGKNTEYITPSVANVDDEDDNEDEYQDDASFRADVSRKDKEENEEAVQTVQTSSPSKVSQHKSVIASSEMDEQDIDAKLEAAGSSKLIEHIESDKSPGGRVTESVTFVAEESVRSSPIKRSTRSSPSASPDLLLMADVKVSPKSQMSPPSGRIALRASPRSPSPRSPRSTSQRSPSLRSPGTPSPRKGSKKPVDDAKETKEVKEDTAPGTSAVEQMTEVAETVQASTSRQSGAVSSPRKNQSLLTATLARTLSEASPKSTPTRGRTTWQTSGGQLGSEKSSTRGSRKSASFSSVAPSQPPALKERKLRRSQEASPNLSPRVEHRLRISPKSSVHISPGRTSPRSSPRSAETKKNALTVEEPPEMEDWSNVSPHPSSSKQRSPASSPSSIKKQKLDATNSPAKKTTPSRSKSVSHSSHTLPTALIATTTTQSTKKSVSFSSASNRKSDNSPAGKRNLRAPLETSPKSETSIRRSSRSTRGSRSKSETESRKVNSPVKTRKSQELLEVTVVVDDVFALTKSKSPKRKSASTSNSTSTPLPLTTPQRRKRPSSETGHSATPQVSTSPMHSTRSSLRIALKSSRTETPSASSKKNYSGTKKRARSVSAAEPSTSEAGKKQEATLSGKRRRVSETSSSTTKRLTKGSKLETLIEDEEVRKTPVKKTLDFHKVGESTPPRAEVALETPVSSRMRTRSSSSISSPPSSISKIRRTASETSAAAAAPRSASRRGQTSRARHLVALEEEEEQEEQEQEQDAPFVGETAGETALKCGGRGRARRTTAVALLAEDDGWQPFSPGGVDLAAAKKSLGAAGTSGSRRTRYRAPKKELLQFKLQ